MIASSIELQLVQLNRKIRQLDKYIDIAKNRELKIIKKKLKSNKENKSFHFNIISSPEFQLKPIPLEFTIQPWNYNKSSKESIMSIIKILYEYTKENNLINNYKIYPDDNIRKLFKIDFNIKTIPTDVVMLVIFSIFRWQKLRRIAHIVGKWAIYLKRIYNHIHYRPGSNGAINALIEFNKLAIT